MKVYAIALAAGVPFRTERFGRYFRLVSTSAPLVVNLYKRNAIVYDADNVEGGFWATPEEGFDAFELVSAGVQTVYVGVSLGNAGYDRSQGSVQITGPLNAGWVGVSIPNISTTYTDNFAGRYNNAREMLFTEDLGIPAGVSTFQSTTAMAANTPENIFSAASNVNGAIFWVGLADFRCAGVVNGAFLSKATAPANVNDGAVWAIQRGGTVISSDEAAWIQRERPQRIASGLRLDVITTLATTKAHKHVEYSLL